MGINIRDIEPSKFISQSYGCNSIKVTNKWSSHHYFQKIMNIKISYEMKPIPAIKFGVGVVYFLVKESLVSQQGIIMTR